MRLVARCLAAPLNSQTLSRVMGREQRGGCHGELMHCHCGCQRRQRRPSAVPSETGRPIRNHSAVVKCSILPHNPKPKHVDELHSSECQTIRASAHSWRGSVALGGSADRALVQDRRRCRGRGTDGCPGDATADGQRSREYCHRGGTLVGQAGAAVARPRGGSIGQDQE